MNYIREYNGETLIFSKKKKEMKKIKLQNKPVWPEARKTDDL